MNKDKKITALKIILTILMIGVCYIGGMLILLLLSLNGFWAITIIFGVLILPLIIPFIWLKKRKVYALSYLSYLLCFALLAGTQTAIDKYEKSITINTAPAINVNEYLPFKEDSKIVKIQSQTLDFSSLDRSSLPIIDGAAAVFPVYSAFVNATYPDTTEIYDGIFEYNNTVEGYKKLAEKETDIFVGAGPSKEQLAYAESQKTTFKYTQIGWEAFVFFVNKDNPIDSLTVDQIKKIYSGEITNWREVGGKNENIVPYQRNEGSGSQSMLIRFMGDAPILPPTTETQVDGMGGIIETVANFKNKSNSIGFSFRFYVEGIIKNPDVKMIAINGIKPTAENVKNSTYPIITPLYAMSREGNEKESVETLINWMLSAEGQFIIEQTGYVGIN